MLKAIRAAHPAESPRSMSELKAPLGEPVDIMDVGFACAYLASDFARRITGGTIYVDGGANVVA